MDKLEIRSCTVMIYCTAVMFSLLSRFHLLAEFDDGKRSCRKRLAGHNERRRKPQVGIHSGKPGRLLQPYGGNNIFLKLYHCKTFLPPSLTVILPIGT